MKKVAIMQPTFLPWIGYFSLIDKVDEFIFLDNVQFDKRSWQQRNKIKTKTGAVGYPYQCFREGDPNNY